MQKEREKLQKKIQEYEQKYHFINKALLESVAQITEMTKPDHLAAMARVKSADKMVMLPPLFDSTKPEVAKQHYKRFNQYIKFQMKSGNIRDPIGEAIELFEHTLDKKALVWFQEHKDKFVDLTTLKTMFLQRYNPWGKTKQDQLQSWNILMFDPQKTNMDEHIDLTNTLGDMLGQKEECKKDKFIDMMPTIIQTHLITEKTWADTTKKAKELEHIIRKCDPPAALLPTLAKGTTVPGLYSHIAHSNDKDEMDIPQPFKGASPKQPKSSSGGKGKQPQQKPKNPPLQTQDNQYNYDDTNNYYHNDNYRGQSRGCRPYRGQNTGRSFRGQNFHGRGQRNQNTYQGQYQNDGYQSNNYQGNQGFYHNPCRNFSQGNSYNLEVEVVAETEVIITAMVAVGPIIEVMLIINIISIMVMMMSTRWTNMAHLVLYVEAIITPPNIALRESMTLMILWKRLISTAINHSQAVYIPKGEHDNPHELPQHQDLEGSPKIDHTLYSHSDTIEPTPNPSKNLSIFINIFSTMKKYMNQIPI